MADCYSEVVPSSGTSVALVSNPKRSIHELTYPKSTVTSVDVLPVKADVGGQEAAHDVVLVYDDGQIEYLSGNLQTRRWAVGLDSIIRSQGDVPGEWTPGKIEYTVLTDAETARKGLLKNREDVVAALDPGVNGRSATVEVTPVLCLVTATEGGSRYFHMLSLLSRSADRITTHHPAVQHLLTYRLPKRRPGESPDQNKPIYSLHAASGTMHQLALGSLVTYDLSGTVPRIHSELGDDIRSFVRLSSCLVVAASSSSCAIYDTRYKSIQSVLPTTSASVAAKSSGKRRHPEVDSHKGSVHLLAYHSDIGLVLALDEGRLTGAHVGSNHNAPKRSKTRHGHLIDSIGRGLGASSCASTPSQLRGTSDVFEGQLPGAYFPQPSHWNHVRVKLDRYAAQQDVEEFEKLFAKELGIPRDESRPENPQHHGDAQSSPETKLNGVHNGATVNGARELDVVMSECGDSDDKADEPPVSDWQFPDDMSMLDRNTDRRKTTYALSKIFAWNSLENGSVPEKEGPSISVEFFLPNVFRWLVKTGHLSAATVESALRKHSKASDRARSVSEGDIITAIHRFDPSMHLLDALLTHPNYLEASEIVQAVKLLIQSLDNPEASNSPILVTNGEATLTNGELTSTIQTESEAADDDLAFALSTLENGLSIRSQALRHALTKLHSFPPSTIVVYLRSMLSQHELIFLIHILRIELADGGWTSRYTDAGPGDTDVETPSDRGIAVIGTLLNCAVDAVGVGGWLQGLVDSAEDTVKGELLASLRAEVSAALEGCHEAVCLKTILNDFVRYGTQAQKAGAQPFVERIGDPQIGRRKGGKKQREVSKPVTVEVVNEEDNLLPLGYKVRGMLDMKKVVSGTGEVVNRSKREMGREISMRVGKYSIERIRI
ncbi:hypothetical protein LTR04_006091 [Oleoguttula sp. CCFEE 6159]|nr:hypothetical protein LTR04_006091 [Oleoguttula sp. CCFEE 6159]